MHSKIEKEIDDLKSSKILIEKKIHDLFMLLKESNPKSLLECQQIFVNSTLYDGNNALDAKIMHQGMIVFFRNYNNYEKENIAPQATPSKRKR